MATPETTIAEQIRKLALEIIAEKTEGIKFSELHRSILEKHSECSPSLITAATWDLEVQYPDQVYKPERGVFRLLKFKEKKSFFEYLGIADVERVHSQFFAWIFSSDCNAFNSNQKDDLVQKMFALNSSSHVKETQTERSGIDILIRTDKEIVIIENKIKSSQHSNQLEKYKEYCEKHFPSEQKHYYFLTLTGEHSDHKDWKRISYSQVYRHLKSTELKPEENHTVIINEYLIFLDRLVTVVEDFKENANKYDKVFLDGDKKKEDKINAKYDNESEKFIAENQLETILQKSFLSSLVEQIRTPKGLISETWGDALVDFILESDIEYEGRNYATMIQLQEDTIKFAFVIHGENYSKSDKKWIEKVIPIMETLSSENNHNYKKLNNPTSKAYVSISKKLDPGEHYWHKNIVDLANLVKKEIENGKELTEQLLKLNPSFKRKVKSNPA